MLYSTVTLLQEIKMTALFYKVKEVIGELSISGNFLCTYNVLKRSFNIKAITNHQKISWQSFYRFFIILRGSVSVMIKDQADDLDLGDETLEARQFERAQLGNAVVQLRMYLKNISINSLLQIPVCFVFVLKFKWCPNISARTIIGSLLDKWPF